MNEMISRAIEHAADQLHRPGSVTETLELIVRSAAEVLPTFDHVGVSTVEADESVVTRASTSALVLELDELQSGLREGPFFDSLTGHHLVVAPRIGTDERWPAYVTRTRPHGLRSQMAVRLHSRDLGTVGGLTLYSTTHEEIEEDAVTTAAYFALHATAALVKARDRASLAEAAVRRQLIGQAIGVLMERYGIDDKAAHAFLWRASAHTNVKVRDLAASLIADANQHGSGRPSSRPGGPGGHA